MQKNADYSSYEEILHLCCAQFGHFCAERKKSYVLSDFGSMQDIFVQSTGNLAFFLILVLFGYFCAERRKSYVLFDFGSMRGIFSIG